MGWRKLPRPERLTLTPGRPLTPERRAETPDEERMMTDTAPATMGDLYQLRAYAERRSGPPGRRASAHVADRCEYLERRCDELGAQNDSLSSRLRAAQQDLSAAHSRADFLAAETDVMRAVACMAESLNEDLIGQRDRLAAELAEAKADADEQRRQADACAKRARNAPTWCEMFAVLALLPMSFALGTGHP